MRSRDASPRPVSPFGAAEAAALLAFLALILASCWRPAFDLELSESERLARKLDRLGGFSLEGVERREAEPGYFLPHLDLAPSSGFWVFAGESELRLRYVDYSAGGAAPSSSYAFGNALGGAASVSALSSSAAGFSAINRGVLIACGPSMGEAQALAVDSLGTIYSSGNYVSISGPGSSSLVGAHRSPNDLTSDRLALLYRETSTGQLWGGSLVVSNQAAFSGGTASLEPLATYGGLDLRPGAFFGRSESGYFYLSGLRYSDGGLVTIRWPNTVTDLNSIVLPGVARQLSAILSDGRLLARDGTSTLVYGAAGDELFELKTGPLRFVHEVYDSGSGAWYSYFSRSVFSSDSGDDSSGRLRVEVYRIATAKLGELAD